MLAKNLCRIVTTKFDVRELRNLSHFTLIASDPDGGTKLMPVSQNERYDPIGVRVKETLDSFAGLPGFVTLRSMSHDLPGRVHVNMERVSHVTETADHGSLHFPGSTTKLNVQEKPEEILVLLHASPLAVVAAGAATDD
jgi:hypothetical protein